MAGKVKPYGDVDYADPGYRENRKRYPIDTPEHIRAAWAYINVSDNAKLYTKKQLELIRNRIREAAKEHDIEIQSDSGEMAAAGVSVRDNASSLVASSAPVAPPAAWFADPQLKAPTRLTVTDDGRVFGHLAQWKVCHVGIGRTCVMAPKTRMGYQTFRIGSVKTAEGTLVDIGKISMSTVHADAQWGIVPTRKHYDDTSTVAAIVNVGEDKHGIWVSGALTSTMKPEQVAELRASSLSGDWREVNGNLELIAALAVNSPGFPILREKGGHAFSLTAVGIVNGEDDEDVSTEFGMGKPSMRQYNEDEDMVDAEILDEADVDEEDEDLVEEDEELELDEDEEDEEEEDDEEFALDEDEQAQLAARLARLEDIDADLEQYNQEKRMAQLAAIDSERTALAERRAPTGFISHDDDAVFIQYNARYVPLARDEE